jgi:hypothetical protein
MCIESGTTRERLIRLGIVTIMCAVASTVFLRDGFIKYPRENAERARDNFPAGPEELKKLPLPEFNPRVTAKAFENVHKRMTIEELKNLLGEPAYSTKADVFWVGKQGCIHVWLDRAGLVKRSEMRAKYTARDLLVQKTLGALSGALALVALIALLRAASLKVVLDDRGLSYNRGPTIEWDQMRALDNSRYQTKGWVTLTYERGPRSEQQRLDSYHVGKFREIITEICSRKGFESPLAQAKPGGEDTSKQ